MRNLLISSVALIALAVASRQVAAEPAWGVNCLSCHGEWQPQLLMIVGEDYTADPDESGTGAPDRGPLPVFEVQPGQVVGMSVEVVGLDPGDTYAVELKRLRFPGVEAGDELEFAEDCDWGYWGEPGKYYTDPGIAYVWGNGPTTFIYDIQPTGGAPVDYYDLVFGVAGRLTDGGALFSSEQHFYLRVVPLLGDMDRDGDVDADDFVIFAGCFSGSGGAYGPGCDLGDFDQDGDIDCQDWVAFADAWTADPTALPLFEPCGGVIPTVSQWGMAVMLLLVAVAGTLLYTPAVRWHQDPSGGRPASSDGRICGSSESPPRSGGLKPSAAVLVLMAGVGSAASATELNLTCKADGCSASAITVGPGCEVRYRVVGELSDGASGGLALILLNLDYDGGDLAQASEPVALPMLNFRPPAGFSQNPAGYGGTPNGGQLRQIGGAQNIFAHGQWTCADDGDCPGLSTCDGQFCTALPGLPTGTMILDVAQPGSPVALVTGALFAPAAPGTYTLSVTNVRAGVVQSGATGVPMWFTEAAPAGAVTNLVITVDLGAECCPSAPPAPLPDDRFALDGTVRTCTEDADCLAGLPANSQVSCVPPPGGQPGDGQCYVRRNRYISIDPNPANSGTLTARRVSLETGGGQTVSLGWVGAPVQVTVGGAENPQLLARLEDTPHDRDWSLNDAGQPWPDATLHLGDCEISPAQTYLVQAIAEGADTLDEANYSEPLVLRTVTLFGDVVGGIVGTPPDQDRSFKDISAVVRGFQTSQTEPKVWLDLQGTTVTPEIPHFGDISFADINRAVKGFQGNGYPFALPCDCPGQACP